MRRAIGNELRRNLMDCMDGDVSKFGDMGYLRENEEFVQFLVVQRLKMYLPS